MLHSLAGCPWDFATFYIIFLIGKQVGQIEADLKVKSQAYNALKTSLQSMEKKQTGSLMTRNLGDLVKKEHFVLDSEYLTTLLVVVPLAMINDWHAKYESLTDMVVPRSTQMIMQDADNALMSVSLFHKVSVARRGYFWTLGGFKAIFHMA